MSARTEPDIEQQMLTALPALKNPCLAAQRTALKAVMEALADNEHVLGLTVSGSLARGEGDRYSDIDLIVETDARYLRPLWEARHEIVTSVGEPIIDLEEQWSTDRIAWYAAIYGDGLYMDAAFRAAGAEVKPDELAIWSRGTGPVGGGSTTAPEVSPFKVEPRHPLRRQADLFWCGSTLCAKYTARGDLWNALGFAESRRSLLIKAYRSVHVPDHQDWEYHTVTSDLPPEIMTRLGATVPGFSARSIAEALLQVMDIMKDLQPGLQQASGVELPISQSEDVITCVHRMLREARVM